MNQRVLVVDDNSESLELMLYLLRAFGYDSEGRNDGIAGLQAAKSGAFILVATDVMMTGIDGFDFARLFKAEPELASTPLIAVTALAMPGDRERLAAAGFDGYIKKPIEPRTFVAQLEAFLPRART